MIEIAVFGVLVLGLISLVLRVHEAKNENRDLRGKLELQERQIKYLVLPAVHLPGE